jgi:hypothetical protein
MLGPVRCFRIRAMDVFRSLEFQRLSSFAQGIEVCRIVACLAAQLRLYRAQRHYRCRGTGRGVQRPTKGRTRCVVCATKESRATD